MLVWGGEEGFEGFGWVEGDETVVAFPWETAEWARNAARKLERKGRLVGIFESIIEDDVVVGSSRPD